MTNTDNLSVPTRWTLEDALGLIRPLQEAARSYGYHLCLGGGVLNRGYSEKDLDLYFLPLGEPKVMPTQLVKWLDTMWGEGEDIGENYEDIKSVYLYRMKFKYGPQRIDVFVMGLETDRDRKLEAEIYGEITETEENGGELGGAVPPGEWAYARQDAGAEVYRIAPSPLFTGGDFEEAQTTRPGQYLGIPRNATRIRMRQNDDVARYGWASIPAANTRIDDIPTNPVPAVRPTETAPQGGGVTLTEANMRNREAEWVRRVFNPREYVDLATGRRRREGQRDPRVERTENV